MRYRTVKLKSICHCLNYSIKRSRDGALVSLLGNASTFWLYGLVAIGAWVFFYRLVPETKGKSVEQIEAHWRSGKPPRQL